MQSSLYPTFESEEEQIMRLSRETAAADAERARASSTDGMVDGLAHMFPEIDREVLTILLASHDGQAERVVEELTMSGAPPMQRVGESDDALALEQLQEEQELAEAVRLSTVDRYVSRVARVRAANEAKREHRLATMGLVPPVEREVSAGRPIEPV
tara:strand:- start:1143 stop:1610 length:468 start_codon:yes stop_codon:yes gene_type:complete